MSKFIDRTGEKRMMKCGMMAEIIRYGGWRDIDVRFEDGQIAYHKNYNHFKRGSISPPNDPRIISHLGEKRMMNCGMEAEIIRYGGCRDIDVRFEDGQEVHHRHYGSFERGQISPPNDPRKIDRTGEKRMMKCGLEATIIRYGGCKDIDVRFKDGQIVKHITYNSFKKGEIKPPNDPRKIDRTGEKRMMKCGLEATIIRYGGWRDIDVRFEDGQIVEHRAYSSFKKGEIAPPINPRKIDRTGEKRMMKCGLIAEIIRYGGCRDIDVQFEDGQIVYHRDYNSFCIGSIKPHKDPRKYKHLGEKRMMNCGLIGKIAQIENSEDITVQFEDGKTVHNKRYGDFIRHTIGHPCFIPRKECITIYDDYNIQFVAKSPDGDVYYNCKCQKCSFEIIDTARNIIKLEHKCETQPTEEGEN